LGAKEGSRPHHSRIVDIYWYLADFAARIKLSGKFRTEYNYYERYAMTDLEQTIMAEISTLPETRLPDVLAFIRYLKLSIPKEQRELDEKFEEALKSIRARAKEMNITEEDIKAEIRAVREGK